MPQREDLELLNQIIIGLSQQYNVQSFEPHVTIYSGEYIDPERLSQTVAESLPPIKPFTLDVAGMDVSPTYSKTLYIEFKNNRKLDLIYKRLSAAIPNTLGFELNPHLSLLYKNTNSNERAELLSQVLIKKRSFSFNRIKLVSPKNISEAWKDITSWEVLLNIELK